MVVASDELWNVTGQMKDLDKYWGIKGPSLRKPGQVKAASNSKLQAKDGVADATIVEEDVEADAEVVMGAYSIIWLCLMFSYDDL